MSAEFRPPAPQAAVIAGPAGPLEARLEEPQPGSVPRAVGVVCHPHPLYGGTMQNKVVHTVARAMQELGVPTVRFNFRGVGASTGAHDEGRGETSDALAAIGWARERWSCTTVWLAGFSFGSAVALQASATARPAALVTVAPPVRRVAIDLSRRPECPWLIVQGDQDELVKLADVEHWARGFEPAPRIETIAGAEHFFHGKLGELREAVIGFLRGLGG